LTILIMLFALLIAHSYAKILANNLDVFFFPIKERLSIGRWNVVLLKHNDPF